MRIIGGSHKGRVIAPPKGFKARPTTDFAKESLFNILENRFDLGQVRVLDLFSGTGGIAYEFASRGAVGIDAVEVEPVHFNFIRKMVRELGLPQLRVVRNDAFKFLTFCTEQYDIVFADPPYNSANLTIIPATVLQRRLLRPNGRLVLEHASQRDFSASDGFIEARHYGGVNFSFFGQDT